MYQTLIQTGFDYVEETVADTLTSGATSVMVTVLQSLITRASSGPSSGLLSVNSSVPVLPPLITGVPSGLISGIPSVNRSVTVLPPIITGVSSGLSPGILSINSSVVGPPRIFTNPTSSVTLVSSSSSASPDASSISTSATTSSPITTPLPGCPIDNGTIYTTQNQTFQILCDTNYGGPSDQGLVVPSLFACIDDCAVVNQGFSEDQCYGVSYSPLVGPGESNCDFRGHQATSQPLYDPTAISAMLVPNLPANSSSTSSISSPTSTASFNTSSSPSTSPTTLR